MYKHTFVYNIIHGDILFLFEYVVLAEPLLHHHGSIRSAAVFDRDWEKDVFYDGLDLSLKKHTALANETETPWKAMS